MDDIVPPTEPANLRFLRRLVTVLTATMIFGLLTVVILLVIRLQAPSAPRGPDVPSAFQMPEGAVAHAVTQGPDFWAVVTTDNQILIFDQSGAVQQTILID